MKTLNEQREQWENSKQPDFKSVESIKTIETAQTKIKNCQHPLGVCCAPLKPSKTICKHCKYYQ